MNNAFPSSDNEATAKRLGKEKMKEVLRWMLLIRQFEIRGEAAYQQGKVGGFYHSYAGQEAIQVAAISVFSPDKNWYIGFYRCHALALLLGATPNEAMAELYGKETGNAKGRGGSMHLYAERMLGGFGIVGSHLPVAAGAAFALKYLNKKEEVALCFLGEGAVAQGTFHETINLAALWNLPIIFIIENNHWGMGTHVSRALATSEKIAEKMAPAYGLKGYTLNGMNFYQCYDGFHHIREEILKTGRPILVECECDRFRGHSISDPGLYRSKEALQEIMKTDPIPYLVQVMKEVGFLSDEEFQKMEEETREKILSALKFAEESPFPSIAALEEGVYCGN